MEALVFYNMMAEFERKLNFKKILTLKTHFTDNATEVVKLKPSSSLLKWPNNDTLPCQRSLTAVLHHITDQ